MITTRRTLGHLAISFTVTKTEYLSQDHFLVKPTNNVAHELLILITEFAVVGVFSVSNKVLLEYEICHWTFFFSDKKSNGKT